MDATLVQKPIAIQTPATHVSPISKYTEAVVAGNTLSRFRRRRPTNFSKRAKSTTASVARWRGTTGISRSALSRINTPNAARKTASGKSDSGSWKNQFQKSKICSTDIKTNQTRISVANRQCIQPSYIQLSERNLPNGLFFNFMVFVVFKRFYLSFPIKQFTLRDLLRVFGDSSSYVFANGSTLALARFLRKN